jgi:hypothetical protein
MLMGPQNQPRCRVVWNLEYCLHAITHHHGMHTTADYTPWSMRTAKSHSQCHERENREPLFFCERVARCSCNLTDTDTPGNTTTTPCPFFSAWGGPPHHPPPLLPPSSLPLREFLPLWSCPSLPPLPTRSSFALFTRARQRRPRAGPPGWRQPWLARLILMVL